MKKTIFLLFILATHVLNANDGAYTISGNQLVPIHETEISVKKEVLTITRTKRDLLDVKVEYTFYNPSQNKKVLVGFEANEPSGDVTTTAINGGHPYMKNFSVLINGKNINYSIANKEIIKKKKLIKDEEKYSDVAYVYYFEANFKKGINHISHHYQYEPSGSVSTFYEIDYVLSAASRWAGEVIEDFTLIIDVGNFEAFKIANSFFDNGKEWQVDGRTKETIWNDEESNPKNKLLATQFYIKKSPIIFKKKNFKIRGELSLVSWRYYKNFRPYGESFDYKKNALPFRLTNYLMSSNTPLSMSRLSYKIYRNFPYARAGYVFKNKEIQHYFEALDWYQKNPNYKIGKKILTSDEQDIYDEQDRFFLKMLKNIPYAKRGYIFKNSDLSGYFKNRSWYKKNKTYKAHFSSLPLKEQKWLEKIKSLKVGKVKDIYVLLDEYTTIYNNCLHKHERAKVHKFMQQLSKMSKAEIKARFSKKEAKRIDEDIIDDISSEITKESLSYFAKNFSDETDGYSIELIKDEHNEGCYEYLYTHNAIKGEYGFFIGIGKENGQFKIVRLNIAG